jgi:uncharacterized protein (TIGR00255 family)
MSAPMIFSMTGFAAVNKELTAGRLALEIKSVNHRYLEFQCRMPDELRSCEGAMRDAVAAKLARGKVECRITYQAVSQATENTLNTVALEALATRQATLLQLFPQARPLTVWEIMHAPGVEPETGLSAVLVREPLLACLDHAITELNASRAREGAKLAALIVERLDGIEALIVQVTPYIPQLVQSYQLKLAQKLRDASVESVNDERLRQEVVLFASRIDVAEELNRLSTHVSEVRRVLKAGGNAGKRLDFLMQELNREANTLGSKSAAPEVTRISIELKVLIEQMREQIQNIE